MAEQTETPIRETEETEADVKALTEPMAEPPRQTAAGHIFVKVDMEGVSGVVSREQIHPDGPEYEYGRRMLMHDLSAVLDGAFSAGCTGAVVYDDHLGGRNVDVDALDSRVSLIAGRPQLQSSAFQALDESFAALFLVGFHARAGAEKALMPGTHDPDVACMRINGTEVGEIGLEAAIAGECGVPVVFVSADSGGVLEALELLGEDVEAVQVKEAITQSSGICLPVARTEQMLRRGAAEAMLKAPEAPPVVFQSPATLEVVFTAPESAAALQDAEDIRRIDEVTIRTEGASVLAAYRHLASARAGRHEG